MQQTEGDKTNLSSVYITLNGEKTIVASPHFCEGIRDKIRFWKVIRVPENVGKCKRVGSEQPVATNEATVGESVTVLIRPDAKDVVVLLVDKLCKVSYEERGRGRGRNKAKRGAETGDDEEE